MQYNFEMAVASAYGVDEAIFVHRLYWWVRDNAANNRNYRDGHYWTYDSLSALTEIFPCWTRRQLERIIKSCLSKGLILTADYNENRRDRTTWYTVTDIVFELYQEEPPDVPERGNALHETVKCISPNGDAHFTKRGNVYKEQLEDHLEDERERAHARESEPSHEPDPETYGEFCNVRLKPGELDKLLARWTPAQVQAEIDALSTYMKSKGKKYADHYATLLNWLKRDHPPGASGGLIEEDWVDAAT